MMQTGKIIVKVDGNILEGDTFQELYQKILKNIVDSGKIKSLQLPVETINTRYILEQQSDDDQSNLSPLSYRGYNLKIDEEKASGLKHLEKYILQPLGIDLEIIELGNRGIAPEYLKRT